MDKDIMLFSIHLVKTRDNDVFYLLIEFQYLKKLSFLSQGQKNQRYFNVTETRFKKKEKGRGGVVCG